ncbi:MAG: hypothetical protein ABEJ83_00470 [Candidatus Nanohaloarchaea archaeon]
MNVATKVVGAMVLIVILISALYGISMQIINDSGEKGVDAGNNRTELLGCISRNSHRDNPREWCKQNMAFSPEGDNVASA